jgi:hypothetical protein
MWINVWLVVNPDGEYVLWVKIIGFSFIL